MKELRTRRIGIATLVLCLSLAIGCSKSSNMTKSTTPTPQQLLTAHDWNLTDSKYTGASGTIDFPPLAISTYAFKTNGHYEEISPAFTNSPADTISGTWSLTNNNTTLNMDYKEGPNTTSYGSWTINSITTSQFVLSVLVNVNYNNVDYTSEIITYKSVTN